LSFFYTRNTADIRYQDYLKREDFMRGEIALDVLDINAPDEFSYELFNCIKAQIKPLGMSVEKSLAIGDSCLESQRSHSK
jgi:hypothetical protein